MSSGRQVAVAGVGMTAFGKQPDTSLKQLVAEAAAQALADAALTPGDIGAAYFSNAIGGSLTGQEMVAGQVTLRSAGFSDIPIFNIENACASGSTALHLAFHAVASGQADRVLCIGAEKMSHPEKGRALAAIGGAADVEEVFGSEGPQLGSRSYFMDLYAELARAYMQRTGATAHDFAEVAAKNHTNGGRNPLAQYGGAMTADEVMAAREIVAPLTLPMCSPISDGAAAVVLVAQELDSAGYHPRVVVAGTAVVSGTNGGRSASYRAAQQAYAQADFGPDDLDLAEVHDATASAEVALYEELSFAEIGDGPKLVQDGATSPSGKLPVNVSGGLLAKGHPIGATGVAQICEVTTQLRGVAGERQVKGARRGLTHNAGGWVGADNAVAAVTLFGVPVRLATPILRGDDLAKAWRLHEVMVRIRCFELRVAALFRDGELPGFVHLALGQESVAAGVIDALEIGDYITATHRGHGHIIAKGGRFRPMIAELMGRSTGYCRGKGGSMHIFDLSLGILGANGILGAGQPIAVGAAISAKLRKTGQVAVTFFGEGASAQGAVHEAMNLAAASQAPVLFVAEINGYAELTPYSVHVTVPSLTVRAAGYGMPGESVDGLDVMAVSAAAQRCVASVRASGPMLLEVRTERWHGHYEGDPQRYREPDELRSSRDRDPIAALEEVLLQSGVEQAQLDAARADVEADVDDAVEFGRASALPKPEDALEDVYSTLVGGR